MEKSIAEGWITNPEMLSRYGQDWSGVLTPAPKALVFPKTTEEVAEILSYCSRNEIPVVPSGGRTGLSGGAVAEQKELILSLEKMTRLGPVDTLGLTMQAEAGAITQNIHEHCRVHGLTWPVDFASKGSSTLGGNIATNAGGIRVLRYGNTRNWILGIKAVTMDGQILELNGALEKNNTGFDLRNLLIGSEGCLAVVTEATLKLTPLPQATSLCFFSLADFSSLLNLFSHCRRSGLCVSAFETLDGPSFELVLKHQQISRPLQKAGEVYGLVEVEHGEHEGEKVAECMAAWADLPGILDSALAQSPREKEELWKIRESVAEAIMTNEEVHQQDVSVPVASLKEFYSDIRSRYSKAYPDFSVFFFGHIGDGNLHIFIRRPRTMEPEEFHRICAQSDLGLFEYVRKFAGSVSAEHGIGLLKKAALSYSRSPQEISLFRSIKGAFDPKFLLNPRKIFDPPHGIELKND
jgi:FAD/FMN-containing dehydrogenase